jgi:hypothetical protein
MCAGGGDIPSTLCVRTDTRPGSRTDTRPGSRTDTRPGSRTDICPGARADIRHSSRGNGDPRQLWLEVSFQRLLRERG